MADLQSLYRALEKADAAGDTQSAKQLADYIRGLSGSVSAPPPPPEGGFVPAVKRGFYQTGVLLGDVLPAMAARAVGAGEYAEKQWKEAAATQQKIQREMPAAVPSYTDVKSLGDAWTYAKEAVGESIASLLPAILTGGLAGVAGRGATIAAKEAAERVLLAEAAKMGPPTKAAIDAATAAGVKAAQREALKYQAAGAFAGSAAQNIPEVYQNIKEATGKEDLGAALAFGGFNAALDAVMPVTLLAKVRKAGIPEEQIMGAWYKRFAKGAGKGFLIEGGTEAAQETSSAAAEKFVDENQQFFSEKNFNRVVDAFLKGGIGGGVITGTTDVATGRKEAPKQFPGITTPPPPAGTTVQEEEEEAPPAPPAPAGAPAPAPATRSVSPDMSVEDLLKSLTGAKDAGEAITPPSGAGVQVAGEPGAKPAAEGAGTTVPGGVVPPVEDAGQPAGGEGAKPPPVSKRQEEQDRYNELFTIKAQRELTPKEADEYEDLELTAAIGFLDEPKLIELGKPSAVTPSTPSAAAPPAPPPPSPPLKVEGAPPPVVGGAPGLKEKIGKFDAAFGEDEDFFTRGAAELTPAQKERERELEAEGKRLGVVRKDGETARQYWARVKPAMTLESEIAAPEVGGLATRAADVEPSLIAAQEIKPERQVVIPEEQKLLYEETRQAFNQTTESDQENLPEFDKLRPEEKRVYFTEHIRDNSQFEHDEAAQALSEYLQSKNVQAEAEGRQAVRGVTAGLTPEEKQAEEVKAKTEEARKEARAKAKEEVSARYRYERQRPVMGQKTGLAYSFPTWGSLSEASRNLFTTINKTDSANEQDLAFRAIRKQIQTEKAEQQRREALQSAESQVKNEIVRAAERARKAQPAGKGAILPDEILSKLLAGDVKAVLRYLGGAPGEVSKGEPFGRYKPSQKEGGAKGILSRTKEGNWFSRQVYEALANALQRIDNFNVNIVFDENMVFDEIGKYDAATNTIYLGPNGLDEATLLHELTHAATVKIINQYFSDKTKLDARSIKAVEHLIEIAGAAKNKIGSKYPNAFENLYEFIAYAMTDGPFQQELANISIPRLAKATAKTGQAPRVLQTAREVGDLYDSMFDNLWDYFTGTLAYLYRLFTPSASTQKVYLPTEKSRVTTKTAQRLREEELKGKLAAQKKKDLTAAEERLAEIELEEGTLTPAERREERKLSAADVEALQPEKLFAQEGEGITPEDAAEAKIAPVKGELVTQLGITNLRRSILIEPGYKGNLLLEISSAFQDILAAPEGGIERIAGKGSIGTELLSKSAAWEDTSWVQMLGSESETGLAMVLLQDYDNVNAKIAETESKVQKEKEKAEKYPDKRAVLEEQAQWLGRDLPELKQKLADIEAQLTSLRSSAYQQRDAGTELPSRGKAGVTKKAPPKLDRTPEEIQKALPLAGKAERPTIVQALKSQGFWQNVVRKFQNAQEPLKRAQEKYDAFGKIIYTGDKINNVWSQATLATGRAWWNFVNRLAGKTNDVHKAIENFATVHKLTVDEALQVLHGYSIVMHEPERRKVKYIKTVPLEPAADAARKKILESLAHPTTKEADAVKYRQMLDKIVNDPNNHAKFVGPAGKAKPVTPEMAAKLFDEKSEKYNVAGNYTTKELAEMRKFYTGTTSEFNQDMLKDVFDKLKEVQKETIELNKEANYWSQGVSNIVAFNGWKHYVPLKGRPGALEADEDLDPLKSRKIGGELQEKELAFGGRESDSDNPVLQSLADGARAAMRLGRKDLTLSIKNAVNDGILKGDAKTVIKFEERANNPDALKAAQGEKVILHYEPNGDIRVVKLQSNLEAEAVRRTYREANPLLEKANAITSGIGQLHTRYSLPFAPMNFVRDLLTNAYTLGAELGPKASYQLIAEVSRQVATNGGLFKSAKIAYLMANNRVGEAKAMAAKDPYVADMLEYLEKGGRVSYIQGIAAKGQMQELLKDVGRNNVLKTKDQVEKVFDYWTDMFELASRTASYRVLKKNMLQEGKGKNLSGAELEDYASNRAAEYTKNLANFEQVGEWGKAMGAAFMFFRPAATGAVRALDAVLPAFTNYTNAQKKVTADLMKARGGAMKASADEINKAIADAYKKSSDARAMSASLLGMGMAVYVMALMLSDDDDQERNKVATDDPARWTRNARFFLPGMDNAIQIPWGFGLGSFAATGAQLASTIGGHTTPKEALSNIISIGLDSFLPLPFSRISPIDEPAAFLMDTATPSAFRPFLEFVMNKDGLGREIYNNRQSRAGDAYTGGDNIPEMYKQAARFLFDATNGGIDWSPNTMYFFANNYADGIMRGISGVSGLAMSATGFKEFDPKRDSIVFESFFGSPSNFDARQFSNVENKIKDIERRLNTLKSNNPVGYSEYLQDNPTHKYLVDYYNSQVNGQLRDIRKMMNDIRINREYTPKERGEMLDNLKPIQNLVKRNLLTAFEQISELTP